MTLTIGVGLATGERAGSAIPTTVQHIALETLVAYSSDSRPEPRLAERWSSSSDGLTWRLHLRPNATFHDGERVTASRVRDLLIRDLPQYMGPAIEDLDHISVSGDDTLEFHLKRRSRFLMDSLDVPIQKPVQKRGDPPIGTGPFLVAGGATAADEVEMIAHGGHYAGKPAIDRIVLRGYPSVRSAWADMLRGEVDMLYEVGIDALDSLQPSSRTRIFTFQRPYAYTVILNVKHPMLRNPSVRRALNASIDRTALIKDALRGRGAPALGSVWPSHWAYDADAPQFRYEPRVLDLPVRLNCLYVEPSHERIALALQGQLQEVGVQMTIEKLSVNEGLDRVAAGDFEAALIDVANGPLVRPYLFWHSKGPNNWGNFASKEVDAAFELIQHAPDDAAYKAGVAAFQRAIVNDPPAIFLAWSERARAVSTRFEVPVEPGRDILSTLRLWRPVSDPPN